MGPRPQLHCTVPQDTYDRFVALCGERATGAVLADLVAAAVDKDDDWPERAIDFGHGGNLEPDVLLSRTGTATKTRAGPVTCLHPRISQVRDGHHVRCTACDTVL